MRCDYRFCCCPHVHTSVYWFREFQSWLTPCFSSNPALFTEENIRLHDEENKKLTKMDFSRSCSLSGWSSLFWKWIKSLYFILLFVDLSFFFFFFFPFRRSCLSTRYFYSYISNYSPSFIIILLLLAVAEVAVEAHNLYLLLLLLCIYFLHIFLFYSWNQSALLPQNKHLPPAPQSTQVFIAYHGCCFTLSLH